MITGNELVQALDELRAIRDMMADPDLTGDLLLIAIALRTQVTGRHFTRRHTWLDKIGQDVPRYQPPPTGFDARCDAPMIRRSGPCGQPASRHLSEVDPTTGEMWTVQRCARHDDRALLLACDAHRREWIANGKPRPPHNAGGVLARHFPGPSWPEIYAWAAPHIEQTPGEGKPRTPRPPKLTLIRGGAS